MIHMEKASIVQLVSIEKEANEREREKRKNERENDAEGTTKRKGGKKNLCSVF